VQNRRARLWLRDAASQAVTASWEVGQSLEPALCEQAHSAWVGPAL